MAEKTSNLNIIVNMLGMINQLRILHWQTKSYSEHKAYGNIYDSLNSTVDRFVECYMGRYGRLVAASGKFEISIINYKDIDSTKCIDSCISYLNGLSEPLKEATDLLNIRDEMIGDLNKLKYLLTLK